MRPRVRSVISLIFALLFIVTVPIVILYTAGYGFNWKRERVEKTGSIQVETTPTAAEVLLDGVPQKKTTPASYEHLLPDDYAVQILKRGYIPWEKTLTVRSGETTFATGITLYQDTLPSLVVDARIDTSAWSPDAKTVAYVSDDGKWQEVDILASGKAPMLLARFPHATYADVHLDWSPAGDAVLFSATTAPTNLHSATGHVTHILKFAADGIAPTLAVHEHFPAGALSAHWSPDGSAIIVTNAAGASSVNPTTGDVSPLRIATGLLDADVRGKDVYVLRTLSGGIAAQSVVIERGTGAGMTAVAQVPVGEYRFATGTDRYLAIIETKKGRMTVVSLADGSATTYDATDIMWDAKGSRALVWNEFEVSLINLDDGSETLITRLGTTISQCAWSPSGDAAIYATPNGIFVAEFDDRDRRVVGELVRVSKIGAFAVDAKANILRFVGSIGNQHGVYERDL